MLSGKAKKHCRIYGICNNYSSLTIELLCYKCHELTLWQWNHYNLWQVRLARRFVGSKSTDWHISIPVKLKNFVPKVQIKVAFRIHIKSCLDIVCFWHGLQGSCLPARIDDSSRLTMCLFHIFAGKQSISYLVKRAICRNVSNFGYFCDCNKSQIVAKAV